MVVEGLHMLPSCLKGFYSLHIFLGPSTSWIWHIHMTCFSQIPGREGIWYWTQHRELNRWTTIHCPQMSTSWHTSGTVLKSLANPLETELLLITDHRRVGTHGLNLIRQIACLDKNIYLLQRIKFYSILWCFKKHIKMLCTHSHDLIPKHFLTTVRDPIRVNNNNSQFLPPPIPCQSLAYLLCLWIYLLWTFHISGII